MGLNAWQLLLVLAIFLLLFGKGRVPALMSDLAAGIKSFKNGIREDETSSQTERSIAETESKKSAEDQTALTEQPVKNK